MTDRSNIDVKINSNGEDLVDFIKDCQLPIVNGRKGTSEFTCFRHNGESVVDYFIMYHQNMDSIHDSQNINGPGADKTN